MLKENLAFLREAFVELEHTGAIFPTTKWAAKALTKPLRSLEARQPLHILELGPGNGSVTVKILEDMQPGDTLTICEINPRLMLTLKNRLRKLPRFQALRNSIRFELCPAQELTEDRKYDVVICALPFLNFDLQTVQDIFTKIHRVSAADMRMTFYEYIGLRKVRRAFASKEKIALLNCLDAYFAKEVHKNRIGKEHVWLNVLPINVYELRTAA